MYIHHLVLIFEFYILLCTELVRFTLRSSHSVVADESNDLAGVTLIDKLVNRIDHINEDVSCLLDVGLCVVMIYFCRFVK